MRKRATPTCCVQANQRLGAPSPGCSRARDKGLQRLSGGRNLMSNTASQSKTAATLLELRSHQVIYRLRRGRLICCSHRQTRRQSIFCLPVSSLFAGATEFSQSITRNVHWPTSAQDLTTFFPLQSWFSRSQRAIPRHTSMHGNGLKIWGAIQRTQHRSMRSFFSHAKRRCRPFLQSVATHRFRSTAVDVVALANTTLRRLVQHL